MAHRAKGRKGQHVGARQAVRRAGLMWMWGRRGQSAMHGDGVGSAAGPTVRSRRLPCEAGRAPPSHRTACAVPRPPRLFSPAQWGCPCGVPPRRLRSWRCAPRRLRGRAGGTGKAGCVGRLTAGAGGRLMAGTHALYDGLRCTRGQQQSSRLRTAASEQRSEQCALK